MASILFMKDKDSWRSAQLSREHQCRLSGNASNVCLVCFTRPCPRRDPGLSKEGGEAHGIGVLQSERPEIVPYASDTENEILACLALSTAFPSPESPHRCSWHWGRHCRWSRHDPSKVFLLGRRCIPAWLWWKAVSQLSPPPLHSSRLCFRQEITHRDKWP